MMIDPEKNEQLRKKKPVFTTSRVFKRSGSVEPAPLARIEEAEAMRRAEELQGYRVVLRCRAKLAED